MTKIEERIGKIYEEASAIQVGIAEGTVELERGIVSLDKLIGFIINDIRILNEESYNQIDKNRKANIEVSKIDKIELMKRLKAPEDAEEERNLRLAKLSIDFKRLNDDMNFIAKICHSQQWM